MQGRTLKLEKRRLFSYVLGTMYANVQQFSIKWSFRRNSQTKMSAFIVVKSDNFCLIVSPEAPFYWNLLIIDIVVKAFSAKDIAKKVPNFTSRPAPPTLPIIRLVLLHTEYGRLFGGSV